MIEIIIVDAETKGRINRYEEGRDEIRLLMGLQKGDVVIGRLGEVFEVDWREVSEDGCKLTMYVKSI